MQSTTHRFARKLGYFTSMLAITTPAAIVSYGHIRQAAIYGHQSPALASLYPLSIDGLMVLAQLAIADDRAEGRAPRGWARFGFWFGAVISVAANVASTLVKHSDPLSIAGSALPPAVLLVALEIVSRKGKLKAPAISAEMAEVPVSPAVVPADISIDRQPKGGERAPYGPRGDEYSERHGRRLRRGR